jgi:formylglycine-generating enzyme required for sulfatase activity
MPVFELSDLVAEILALWLVWSGAAWLALAAFRFRTHRLDTPNTLLVSAAVVGWLTALRLGTGLLGGSQLIPLDLVPLVWSGLPVYIVVSALFVAAIVLARLARASRLALGVTLGLSLAVPAVALIALLGDAEQVTLFSDPLPETVAQPIPAAPITDAGHPGMVLVPAGPFIMGTLNEAQRRPIVGSPQGDEQPVRTVYLDAFYIDRTEVTNAEFARFVAATRHVTDAEQYGAGQIWGPNGWFEQEGAQWRHPMGPGDSIDGLDEHPVVQVSWNDATAFCAWSGKRLPREAEWEKAARGVDARDYPWGVDFDPTKLNYCDAGCFELPHNDSSASDGHARTAPVGSFPAGASPYGALDMVGNAWEWVQDWYDSGYYATMPSVNPPGPERSAGIGATEHRVVRGGSWTSEPDFTRTTSRSYDPPTNTYFGVGFRCATDG